MNTYHNLKKRYTKIKDWINVITLLYENGLETSMVDKIVAEKKEAHELKNVYNQYLDKRTEIKKNTSFKVEDVFGDVKSKDFISPEQITNLNNFLAKVMWKLILV